MKTRNAVLAGFLPLAMCAIGWSQQKPVEDKILSSAPMSGSEMFQVYCAVCHGKDAKGDGPVAPALKVAPPDITLLSRKSGGKFPLMRVSQSIAGDLVVLPHGTREMPVYGDLFRGIRRDEMFVKQRVALLTGYIESLQRK